MNILVSFELAKMLKEVGFDFPVCNVFETSMLHGRECYFFEKEYELDIDNHNKKDGENTNYYSRPTIADVVMWLYKKHGIWVCVDKNKESKFKVHISPKDKNYYVKGIVIDGAELNKIEWYNSPREAYIAAIEYALKNLI